jgi:ferritin-like metal-binding protein YciE
MSSRTCTARKINLSAPCLKWQKAATSRKLKAGFEGHLRQTEQHVARLEKIFKGMKKKGLMESIVLWKNINVDAADTEEPVTEARYG